MFAIAQVCWLRLITNQGVVTMALISSLVRWVERSRLRQELLRLDAHLLADAGFSRALLEEGVRAWPWTVPEEPPASIESAARNLTASDYLAAITELESYTDADLQDLGLSRGMIGHSVRYGR